MNSISGKTFIATNILIYGHDTDAGAKHQIAKSVLRDFWSERTGVLNVQVLQEFYVNVRRKISSPLSKNLAHLAVSGHAIWCREKLRRHFGSRTNGKSVSGMP
jgi:predicted nucleic acid-binding protein